MSRFLEAATPPEGPMRQPIPALLRIESAVRKHLAGDSDDLEQLLSDAAGHAVHLAPGEPLDPVLDRLGAG